jgi:hypothetical protein
VHGSRIAAQVKLGYDVVGRLKSCVTQKKRPEAALASIVHIKTEVQGPEVDQPNSS